MKFKTLSIIVPCFNEFKTIEKILKKVEAADTLSMHKEIIVIDDGSHDRTKKYLETLQKKAGYKIIFHKHNQGKGSAVKTGLLASTGDIVLIQDADLEYDPREYPNLLEPIMSDLADIVYGSRFVGGRPHRVVYYWHSVMNNILTTFSNMMTNINLTDMETCYKVFRGDLIREIAPNLVSAGFGFEPEITARLSKIPKIRFYEVGVSYYGRTYEEGKHITGIDGIKALWQIIKFNWFS